MTWFKIVGEVMIHRRAYVDRWCLSSLSCVRLICTYHSTSSDLGRLWLSKMNIMNFKHDHFIVSHSALWQTSIQAISLCKIGKLSYFSTIDPSVLIAVFLHEVLITSLSMDNQRWYTMILITRLNILESSLNYYWSAYYGTSPMSQ